MTTKKSKPYYIVAQDDGDIKALEDANIPFSYRKLDADYIICLNTKYQQEAVSIIQCRKEEKRGRSS